jgi:hypothetical protein
MIKSMQNKIHHAPWRYTVVSESEKTRESNDDIEAHAHYFAKPRISSENFFHLLPWMISLILSIACLILVYAPYNASGSCRQEKVAFDTDFGPYIDRYTHPESN